MSIEISSDEKQNLINFGMVAYKNAIEFGMSLERANKKEIILVWPLLLAFLIGLFTGFVFAEVF